MKIFFLIFLFIISFASYSKDKIDIIIVKKSERILYAIKDDKVIAIDTPKETESNYFWLYNNFITCNSS